MACSCFLSLVYSFSSDSWDLPFFLYSSSLLCPEHRYPVYAMLDLLFFYLFLLEYYYFSTSNLFVPLPLPYLGYCGVRSSQALQKSEIVPLPLFNSEFPFIVKM